MKHLALSLILVVAGCLPSKATESRSTSSAAMQSGASVAAGQSGDLEGLQAIPLGAAYGIRSSWFDVYFTNPASPLATQFTGGADFPLIEAIDASRLTVDVAAYRLDSFELRTAFLRALDRGVRVRLVMEADDLESSDVQALLRAGVPVISDGPDGRMHSKFMVIDGDEVWTGSMNFTYSGTYFDNNNLLRIRSKELAADFTSEFEEMFSERRFGPNVVRNTPFPVVQVAGRELRVYFAPDDGAAEALEELIRQATQSIHFLAFSFTADDLADAIMNAAADDIMTRGVMDADQVQSNIGGEFDAFRRAGLDVRLDGLAGQMHHKVIVLDGKIVVTGSYNFSASAEERNDENLLVIHDPQLAAAYLSEFSRVYDSALP